MLNIKNIIDITSARIINGDENTIIEKFSISKMKHNKDEFYIPIFWREDRQKYIMEAVKAGANGFMINEDYEEKNEVIEQAMKINSSIIILEVKNVTEAIIEIAYYNRQKNIEMPIIAVTGSVGKSSTCEMIASILKEEKKVLKDNGGNNNTEPLLAFLMLDMDEFDIGVLEVGMGRRGTIEPVSELLIPSVVVINNIGTAHIQNFGSGEEILKEKLKLINFMREKKIVLLNNDDELLQNVKLNDEYNLTKYNLKEAEDIVQNEDYINFMVNIYGEKTNISLKAYGEHNVLNAICAIRIGELFHIKRENIQKGLQSYRNIDRRFNIIKKEDYTIIDDTYNASVASMKAGLITANNMKGYKRKIAVLGEMLELGEFSEKLHTQIGEVFENVNFDILLTQGINTKYICEAAKKYMKEKIVYNFENQEELIEFLLKEIKKDDLIYLKASNKMKFNKIVERL